MPRGRVWTTEAFRGSAVEMPSRWTSLRPGRARLRPALPGLQLPHRDLENFGPRPARLRPAWPGPKFPTISTAPAAAGGERMDGRGTFQPRAWVRAGGARRREAACPGASRPLDGWRFAVRIRLGNWSRPPVPGGGRPCLPPYQPLSRRGAEGQAAICSARNRRRRARQGPVAARGNGRLRLGGP